MIGSVVTRALVTVFGYVYPAYECYKCVEQNKPDLKQLQFWCQYWILLAVLTVCERVGDTFISWVPMYSEAKLAFIVYLWYPKTKGTTYVYDSFFRPYIAKHENEIDRNLLELRTRAGDLVVLYWQRAASYGQTRVFEILQYVASQSTARPQAPQRQPGNMSRQPSTPKRQPSTSSHQPSAKQLEAEEPLSPTSSTSLSQHPTEVAEEVAPPKVVEAEAAAAATTTTTAPASPAASKVQRTDSVPQTSGRSTAAEAEPMQIKAAPSTSAKENANSAPKETIMEETSRVTRARSRKSSSGPNH